MTDESRRYLDKADHALIVAVDLMEQGHAPDAASKFTTPCFTRPRSYWPTKELMLSNIRQWNLRLDTILPSRVELIPGIIKC